MQNPIARRREEYESRPPASSGLIRPLAVKVATIPSQAYQDFTEQAKLDPAYQHDVTIPNATEMANEWHRKWTLQEESGHGYRDERPEEVSTRKEPSSAASSPEFNPARDRELGAKNPSLSSNESDDGSILVMDGPRAPLLRPIAVRPHVPTAVMVGTPMIAPAAPPSPPPMQQHRLVDNPSPLTLPSHSASHGVVEGGPSGPMHFYEDDGTSSLESMPSSIPSYVYNDPIPSLELAKEDLLHALAIHGGEVDTPELQEALLPLLRHYEETGYDARMDADSVSMQSSRLARAIEGMWLTLSKPNYFGNLGESPAGDPLYTLGRMAFDMFAPTQLVCSMQGNFSPIRVVDMDERSKMMQNVPKSLLEEVQNARSTLRTYNIVTAFTIEAHMADYPNAPNKRVRRPIKGIMTNCAYALPDPTVPNRFSIWFSGGKMEPNNDVNDIREWKRFFGVDLPGRNLGERLKLLAFNLMMGAEPAQGMQEDGTLEYNFTRPIGGHGVAYIDVIYLDETLRVVRGQRGTIFVHSRIPDQL
mmetsp:Transcript_49230/g.73399  ORF Transcript_49230/g.73399 Transcript_49230/m.73399 type:complete len:531 (-) Transcript_49230:377-1969(-)